MPAPSEKILVDRQVTKTLSGKTVTYWQKYWVNANKVRPGDKVITDKAEREAHWSAQETARAKALVYDRAYRAQKKANGTAKKPKDPPTPLPDPPRDPDLMEPGKHVEGKFDVGSGFSLDDVLLPKNAEVQKGMMDEMFHLSPSRRLETNKHDQADDVPAARMRNWMRSRYGADCFQKARQDSAEGRKLLKQVMDDIDNASNFAGHDAHRDTIREYVSAVWFAHNKPLVDAMNKASALFAFKPRTESERLAAEAHRISANDAADKVVKAGGLGLSPEAIAAIRAGGEQYKRRGVQSFGAISDLPNGGADYNSGFGRIRLSYRDADELRRAMKYGYEGRPDLFEGVGTLLHELLHSSSHEGYKYEPLNPSGQSTFYRRPYAAVEEATTEYLAFANRRRFAESLGMNIRTPASQMDVPFFRDFTKLGEAPPKHIKAVALTKDISLPEMRDFSNQSSRSCAYRDNVYRFACVAAAAENAANAEEAHDAATRWAAALKTTRGSMRYARLADRFAEKALKGKRDHPKFELARNNIAFNLKRYLGDALTDAGLVTTITRALEATEEGRDLHKMSIDAWVGGVSEG